MAVSSRTTFLTRVTHCGRYLDIYRIAVMMRVPRVSRPLALVLDELLVTPRRRRYGYDLMQATGIPAGTLYPLLVRLSDAGWLDASWETAAEGGRPPRHMYVLTAEGRRGARELLYRAAARGWSAPARREA